MPDSLSVDEAVQRLSAALDALEAALDGRLEHDAALTSLEGELQRLGADRSRMAQSLDAAAERVARLEDTNAEVSRGLVTAMESIRDVLARHGAA